eukprot:1626894-Pleurochrysis_carterae.AAC.1
MHARTETHTDVNSGARMRTQAHTWPHAGLTTLGGDAKSMRASAHYAPCSNFSVASLDYGQWT